jgi:hypothetical protein
MQLETARDALRQKLAETGMSARKLALMINPESPNTISRFLGGGSLKLDTWLAAEEALGLRTGELLADCPDSVAASLTEAAMRGARLASRGVPSVSDFRRWHCETGGRISELSPMLEWVDLYDQPTTTGIFVSPLYLGPLGLAATMMGEASPEKAVQMIGETNRDYCAASARDHADVIGGRTILDERTANETLANGATIDVRFLRSIVRGEYQGRPVAISFAERI